MGVSSYQARQAEWQQGKVAREREKANAVVIDGPFVDLAHEVRRLLGYGADGDRPFLTSRRAADLTGINFVSISKLVRGYAPTPHTLRRFAEKLDGDADTLIRASQRPSLTADPLARIGATLSAAEAAQLGLGDGKRFLSTRSPLQTTIEAPETLVDRLAPGDRAGRRGRVGPRDWTRGLLLHTDAFRPRYERGDLLLLREDPDVRDGLLAIGLWGGEDFRVSYFVRFLEKTFEVTEAGVLTAVPDGFAYLGVITGCVRREDLPALEKGADKATRETP